MARFKVVVTDYVFENFDQEKEILGQIDADLVVCQAEDPAELTDLARDPGYASRCRAMNRELAGCFARDGARFLVNRQEQLRANLIR